MEEAVVGAVVGATIKVVLQNLLSFPIKEIGLIWNFNKDLQKLKNSLLMIRDVLEDAEKKQVTDKAVQRWLMNLEAVVYEVDYVFDQLNYQRLRKKVQNQTGTKTKKKVSAFLFDTISVSFRYRMARKIKEIKNQMKIINQEAMELGLQMRIASSHAFGAGTDTPAYLESDSFSVDPIFIGRENDVAKMVEMVISSPTEEVVSVLPIVGMGGVGKTTLTRKVYNDAAIISHFKKRMWVHVAQNSFDTLTILKEMVKSLTEKKVDGSREIVLQKLKNCLGDKKYLLVLDNVWNESNVKWENLISSLKGISFMKGNVIVVTTRSLNVATIVKTLDIHEIGILSDHDSWLIIKAKTFGGEGDPSTFETIGLNIARKCGGLPLAAQVVGGLLRGKPKHEWVSIEKNWLLSFRGDGNIVSNILKLSFDHLSTPTLKKCFAFCSIIPKSWWMYKDEMIQLWMAEGLLQTDEEKEVEIVGNKVFNILLQSSLLQVVNRDYCGNIERCDMHDLIHDLASSILISKFLDGAHHVRYISRSNIDDSSPISKEHAKCLRALFFTGKISNIVFSSLTRIHVLILNDSEMKELPDEIGKLISLRLLDISHTKIKCLPDSIGDLYLLQTFRATVGDGKASYLQKLPDTFKFIFGLRHLYIPNIKLPPKIGKLTSLQTLPYFQVGDEEDCGIMELGSLKNLKGEIEIHNLEKVCHKEEARAADLFNKTNILKLKLVWNKFRENDQNNDENVLEGLQPHMNLESLKIEGFKGSKFPFWTLRMEVKEDDGDRWMRLDNLLEIELINCEGCEEIPMMGRLPCLKSLKLCRLSKVKSMSSSFYGIEEDNVNKEKIILFPALEKLILLDMENLTTWTEVELSTAQHGEVLVFGRLEYLIISDCRQLKSAPSHFPILRELKVENMESGIPLTNICGSKLTTLKKLKVVGVDGAVSLPDGLFSSNQNLSELEISDCNNLMHLVPCLGGGGASLRKLKISDCSNFEKFPEDLHKLSSLEKLEITGCPNLKSIAYPSGRQGFTSLRCLEFLRCNELIDLPCEILESCVISLEQLELMGSKSITNLPQVMRLAHKMPNLTHLGIACVPKLPEVVAEIGSLRNLKCLSIGGSCDCLEYVSFVGILDRIFPALQSLDTLILFGMKDWDALPDQLKYLITLRGLFLIEFGIQVLPEWFERLSSLTLLGFGNCRKLRSLPSKKAMHGLTRLNIVECPVLKQNLEEGTSDDSEWSKVSHIPLIEIDGLRFSPHAH